MNLANLQQFAPRHLVVNSHVWRFTSSRWFMFGELLGSYLRSRWRFSFFRQIIHEKTLVTNWKLDSLLDLTETLYLRPNNQIKLFSLHSKNLTSWWRESVKSPRWFAMSTSYSSSTSSGFALSCADIFWPSLWHVFGSSPSHPELAIWCWPPAKGASDLQFGSRYALQHLELGGRQEWFGEGDRGEGEGVRELHLY